MSTRRRLRTSSRISGSGSVKNVWWGRMSRWGGASRVRPSESMAGSNELYVLHNERRVELSGMWSAIVKCIVTKENVPTRCIVGCHPRDASNPGKKCH